VAVSFFGNYILQAGTTSIGLNPPSSTASGDLEIIWIANKLSGVTPTTSGTWTSLGSVVVGTGTDGVGTGPIRMTAWWHELTAAATTSTLTITGGNVALCGGGVFRKAGGEVWAAPNMTNGSDTSSGTGFISTGAANFNAVTGDIIYSAGALTANTTLSARSITATGLTLTVTGIDSGGSATGNAIFVWTDRAAVTAGTQSAAAATTATSAASTTGGSLLFRVGLSTARAARPVQLVERSALTRASVW